MKNHINLGLITELTQMIAVFIFRDTQKGCFLTTKDGQRNVRWEVAHIPPDIEFML